MEALLDFTKPIDVGLLDRVVAAIHSSEAANKVLIHFEANPGAWGLVPTILETTTHVTTKMFALGILEKAVRIRWKAMGDETKVQVKRLVTTEIMKVSAKENKGSLEKSLLSRLDGVLVAIVKHEWPHNWPGLIGELVTSASANVGVCTNMMAVFMQLSEDVFDKDDPGMTSDRVEIVRKQFCEEFSAIFELCMTVLSTSADAELCTMTLKTLQRFLTWIPLPFVFQRGLIGKLLERFLPLPLFRIETLRCLTEIASLQVRGFVDDAIVSMYIQTVAILAQQVPPNSDFPTIFNTSNEDDRILMYNIAQFLSASLQNHHAALDYQQPANLVEAFDVGYQYLVRMSYTEDTEMWNICLDHWRWLSRHTYHRHATALDKARDEGFYNSVRDNSSAAKAAASIRADPGLARYTQILQETRRVMITRMVKPEEVLITEDDDGAIVRCVKNDTESVTLFKYMKASLVYLANIDYSATEGLMVEALNNIKNTGKLSVARLNSLCWAIGCVSGTQTINEEKHLLVMVLRSLIDLCELTPAKPMKAVIASDIMYVVGQYPRFSNSHWTFLKVVCDKLFEFMREDFPGVKQMACETFLKIAKKCAIRCVRPQQPDKKTGVQPPPFVDEILGRFDSITVALEPAHILTFVEALACIVKAENNPPRREALLARLLKPASAEWEMLMRTVAQSAEALNNPAVAKRVDFVVKFNIRVASAVGNGYLNQMGATYLNMINLYRAYSEIISRAVSTDRYATSRDNIRVMRAVKKDILSLVATFVSKADRHVDVISREFVGPVFQAILGDYGSSVPDARDPEVHVLVRHFVERLKENISGMLPGVFNEVFTPTLEMIKSDFQQHIDIRREFFKLIHAILQHCFRALVIVSEEQFAMVFQSIVWAFKHHDHTIADVGLSSVQTLIKSLPKHPKMHAKFYSTFLTELIASLLEVLTDSLHNAGFTKHLDILRSIVVAVVSGEVQVPLFDVAAHPNSTNSQYLQWLISGYFAAHFDTVSSSQIEAFVTNLFQVARSPQEFQVVCRDWLVTVKEYSKEEKAELYAPNVQEAAAAAAAAAASVPGMVATDTPLPADPNVAVDPEVKLG